MKNRLTKITAAAVLLAAFALSLCGCGFTGVDEYGVYIDGERVWTNQAAWNRYDRELEACRQALTDCADEMETIMAGLEQFGSFDIVINGRSNEDCPIYSDEREEYLDRAEVSEKVLAAVQVLEDSERFDSFGGGTDEDGSRYGFVKFNENVPGWMIRAFYNSPACGSSSDCEPLDNGWCLHCTQNE